MTISRRRLADYVKSCTKAWARAALIFFPHSVNQIVDLRCYCLRRRLLNSLMTCPSSSPHKTVTGEIRFGSSLKPPSNIDTLELSTVQYLIQW